VKGDAQEGGVVRADVEVEVGQGHIIERPRLLKLLDETEARIVLLVAPAGYGKTTLARQWLRRQQQPYVWIRAPRDADDAVALSFEVSLAASALDANCGRRLQTRMAAEGPAIDARSATTLLVRDIEPIASGLIVAVDDLHEIADPAIADLVDRLVECGARFIATSRDVHPVATPRRLVYREVTVVGASELSMTAQETSLVLDGLDAASARKAEASAHGWPALLGLAAAAKAGRRTRAEAASLYDFFAADVLSAMSPERRAALCRLAVFPRLTATLLQDFGDAAANDAFVESVERGLLVADEGGDEYEFHPLFRQFLLERLEAADRPTVATRATEAAQRVGRTDEAFQIIRENQLHGLLPSLIEAGLDSGLASGGLDKLSRWVADADATSPVVALARAEVAFRNGNFLGAHGSALRAARGLPDGHRYRARSYAVAGRAAHMTDRSAEARELFERAREASLTDDDRRTAVWGLFTVLAEQETPDIQSIYSAVVDLDDPILKARADLQRARYEDIRRGLDVDSGVYPLATSITDPMDRAAYLNILANNLVVAGRYGDALQVIETQERDAREFHLVFVEGHVATNKAAALLGLRELDEAAEILASVTVSDAPAWLHENARLIVTRLALARGDLNLAVDLMKPRPRRELATGVLGEYLALAALVAACAEEHDAVVRLADEAESLSSYVDVLVLAPLARFITAIDPEQAERHLRAACDGFLRTGAADALVTAYRAIPRILPSLVSLDVLRDPLLLAIERANDHALGLRGGVETTPDDTIISPPVLSPRETEVLTLMSEGLRNREIAQSLFISEVTVKAHVRSIFGKLGVRTRTEAAIAAKRSARRNSSESGHSDG
jgi:DNA-binding NarL/FixJ family response regulator